MGAKPPWGEILRQVRAEGPILGTSDPIYIRFDSVNCIFKGLKPKALCCGLQGLMNKAGAKPHRYFRGKDPILWPPGPI